jgi:hypothetical protein
MPKLKKNMPGVPALHVKPELLDELVKGPLRHNDLVASRHRHCRPRRRARDIRPSRFEKVGVRLELLADVVPLSPIDLGVWPADADGRGDLIVERGDARVRASLGSDRSQVRLVRKSRSPKVIVEGRRRSLMSAISPSHSSAERKSSSV